MATATKKPAPVIKEYTAEEGIGQRLAVVQRLTLQAETIKETLDKEKSYLLAHAIRNGFHGLRHGSLLASRRKSTTVIYSEALQKAEATLAARKAQALAKVAATFLAAEAALEARKAREVEKGTATESTTETLVVNISGKAALKEAAATVASLEALAERTPSAPVVQRGTDFVPRTVQEGESNFPDGIYDAGLDEGAVLDSHR